MDRLKLVCTPGIGPVSSLQGNQQLLNSSNKALPPQQYCHSALGGVGVNQDGPRWSIIPMGFEYFEKPQIEPCITCSPTYSHFYRPVALGTACTCSPISALSLSQPIASSLRGAGTMDCRLASRPRATAAHAAQRRVVANVLHGIGQHVRHL